MKRLSIVVSMIAALGLATIASAPATAQQHHNKQVVKKTVVKKNVVRSNRTVVRSGARSGARRYVVGRSYNGHVWYGHNRHRWHGRWYDYGNGPCWINVEGEWFWNVIACPP